MVEKRQMDVQAIADPSVSAPAGTTGLELQTTCNERRTLLVASESK